jgi:NADH-quinone oxidoreductase subunit M
MNTLPIITLLTLLPLVGGVLVVGLDDSRKGLARGLALTFSLAALAVVLAMWFQYDAAAGTLQFGERHEWISTPHVQYRVGADGLGLLMLLLSAIVVPMAMLASWRVSERVPLYFALVLFLQAGLFGTFTALNFFHWFLFWELSLIPAYFLIKLWGGPARSAAAMQFFVYTMAGSVTLLLAFLAVYLAAGTFDFLELAKMNRDGTLLTALANSLGWRDLTVQRLALVIFGGAFLGFAVKVPLIPFHTWLPSSYSEARSGTTMLLTGVMSKMGVYGFIRILLPIFYNSQLHSVLNVMLWLTVATIVCGAAAAFAQRDLKRVLAYSSVNHLGYCLLGLFAVISSGADVISPGIQRGAALNGVLLQMFNHGLTAATLFWFVALIEERSGGLRGVNDFGGIRKVAPVFCGMMGIAMFSSLGLPGLNGFIGEFLIFKGAFPLVTWAAALSVLGLLITAVFILTVLQRVFNGPLNPKWANFADLSVGERALLAPPLLLMLLIGLYPQAILGVINGTVVQLVKGFEF